MVIPFFKKRINTKTTETKYMIESLRNGLLVTFTSETKQTIPRTMEQTNKPPPIGAPIPNAVEPPKTETIMELKSGAPFPLTSEFFEVDYLELIKLHQQHLDLILDNLK
jgi:hypothetical protein